MYDLGSEFSDEELMLEYKDRLAMLNKIKSLEETIKGLFKSAKSELAIKDKRIAFLETECTRLYEPTRKFWNDDLEKKLSEKEAALSEAINIMKGSMDCEHALADFLGRHGL